MSDLVERLMKEGGLYEDEARFAIATVLRDMCEPSDYVYLAAREEMNRTESLGNTIHTLLKAYASENGIPLSQGETE